MCDLLRVMEGEDCIDGEKTSESWDRKVMFSQLTLWFKESISIGRRWQILKKLRSEGPTILPGVRETAVLKYGLEVDPARQPLNTAAGKFGSYATRCGVKNVVQSEWTKDSVSFFRVASLGGRGNFVGKFQDDKVGWKLSETEMADLFGCQVGDCMAALR